MKKLREEIEFKGHGGLEDMFDDLLKSAFNITDDEYDFICENATEEDLSKFLDGLGKIDTPATFSEKRQSLIVRNEYLKKFNNK